MSILINALIGLVFGAGLAIGGMTDPAKVLNFLDLAGHWDPTLAFVMGGAVIVAFAGFQLVLRRQRPLHAPAFQLPQATRIDLPILLGPAIFGIGWGLGGFCPGPALAALGFAHAGTLVFVPAMFAGMALARIAASARMRREAQARRLA